MISILGLFVDARHVILFVSPCEFSKAVQVLTQADKGAKADEVHLGHVGLLGDSPIVNTSSQLMHSKASFRFMIPPQHQRSRRYSCS